MKYKYIRLKIIVPAVLLVLVVVFIFSYFVGGLKASTIDYENIEWNLDGFVDANVIATSEDGINKTKVIGDNDKYLLVFDENTTIASLYAKNDGWDASAPLEKVTLLYNSADTSGTKAVKANLNLYYYDNNGKIGTVMNNFDNSVSYANRSTGNDSEKHYQLRYNEDENYVDILYSIGNFSSARFPRTFDRKEFEDTFLGNVFFGTEQEANMEHGITIYEEGTTTEDPSKVVTSGNCAGLMYNGTCNILDNEVALYMFEKGYLDNLIFKGVPNRELKRYTKGQELTAEDIEWIKNATSGFWVGDGVAENGKLKLKLGIDYNCADSPIISNTFLTTTIYINEIIGSQYPLASGATSEGVNYVGYPWYQGSDASPTYELAPALSILQQSDLYNYLWIGTSTVNEDGITVFDKHQLIGGDSKAAIYYDYNGDGIYTEDEYYQYGGYPARDEDGNFMYLYNEDGSIYRAIQQGMNDAMIDDQNEKFPNILNETKITKTVFDVCMRISLVDDGMNVTIINDSIIEGLGADNLEAPENQRHDNVIAKLEICKYMTANKDEDAEGEIIIPDGSGAVISFNSPKSAQHVGAYSEKRIYGNDSSKYRKERGATTEKLLMAMFGFLETSDGKGVVAIVDKGGSQCSISADFRRGSSGNGYNYAFFTATMRELDEIQVTSGSEYKKVGKESYPGDIVVTYKPLVENNGDDITYVGVANLYRKYLIDKYNISASDETKVSNPLFTFVGAYEKKTITAGIVHDKDYSLTTFDEAYNIVKDLETNGVNSMNVSYLSWTEDKMYQEISTKIDVADVLGGKKKLLELSEKLKEDGFGFFPQYNVTNGSGYDLFLGNIKYNARSISGSYANTIQYVLSTGLADTAGRGGNNMSPLYYSSLISKYLKTYLKLDISGIYYSDLGNKNMTDYAKSFNIHAASGALYQRNALQESINKGMDNIMIREPNDYVFEYVKLATEVPISTTLYDIIDASIPLYQLVVNGLFDYSFDYINYENDYSIQYSILKAIETGSNLSFMISASDTNDLLNTNYTRYYNSYYNNWREDIIYMNNVLNEIGIYQSRLVDHEFIKDNVVLVRYANGLEIIINYSNETYRDLNSGLAIRSNWYAIMKGAQ